MKRLVLIGGGHSHVEVLRHFAAQPEPGLELVLLSPEQHAIYSGMIPGVVAGDYAPAACHIDLETLARRAGARWIAAAATGLGEKSRQVEISVGAPLAYELISIDVGSMASTHGIPGVVEHALAVKPAAVFFDRLSQLEQKSAGGAPRRIAVVGAGAAGTEIAFTLSWRLNREHGDAAWVTLVADSAQILPGFTAGARERALRMASARGVSIQTGVAVSAVDAAGLTLADGSRVAADTVIWAAGAAALSWLAATPLATDVKGFISINECLQSVSHPEAFAAGDCAGDASRPWPKSGVFAVRQGPLLARNLRRAVRGEPLLPFRSGSTALAILNYGGRQALAAWEGRAMQGAWVWHWKDWLDRRFVTRYRS